mgnify:CR=1 FL=1
MPELPEVEVLGGYFNRTNILNLYLLYFTVKYIY